MGNQLFVRDKAFYRQMIFFALPVAFQQTINIGVNLMDTIMVGALGEAQLSASSLANQYYYLYYILCLGISGGACVLSAQYYGAGDQKSVRQVWRLAMYLSGGAALIFAVITVVFPRQIMQVYTNDAAIWAQGARYLRVTAAVFFFHGTSLIMVNLLRTVGAVQLGLPVSAVSFVVNILFNYMFIFGRFGAPRLEIAGAAVGTLLSRIVEFGITFGYLFLQRRYLRFTPRDLLGGVEHRLLHAFAKLGVPVIISDGMYTVGDNILSIILGHMSAAIVSANAITLTVMRLCTAFIMGINGASSVMVGQSVGRGQNEYAQRQGNTFYLIACIGGALGGVLIYTVSPVVVGLYNLSEQTAAITMELMAAMSIIMVFQSIQSVMSKGVLRGGGDTHFLMFADLFFLWALNIPLGYFAGLHWGWAPFWVFVCLKLDTICKTFLCLWRLASGRWIRNVNAVE